MARIKIAYLGGGSSRAPGTMASFIHHGAEFDGSHFVLIDLDPDHLEITRRISVQMAKAAGLDITVSATTDLRAGLQDVDCVLSSFRPGNFAARAIDERIPLKYGVIGQETQGPGGLMMSLRSAQVMKQLCDVLSEVAPKARIFNYTNPVNIVSQAVADNTDIPIVSFCEGPIVFPPVVAKAAGLDPDKLHANMTGVNHNVWSNEATYDGQDAIPILRERWEELRHQPTGDVNGMRALHLAVAMESIPSDYFNYFYFRDELLREQQLAPMTRSEVIIELAAVVLVALHRAVDGTGPETRPVLLARRHPRARAGDRSDQRVLQRHRRAAAVQHPERRRDAARLRRVDRRRTLGDGRCQGLPPRGAEAAAALGPRHHPQLAEYQILAAQAGWNGTRKDAIQAMVAHPLVPSLTVAEALYDELAAAQRDWLPERLLH